MTGAIVTSSGDHHRGFHQCPNVLRDKYMPLIGGDGYGYLNYLLSWANTNATLSVRRMKKDLAWSQDKLQRVQAQVLEHCAHFVSMTPGDRVSANGWHLDMEKVWLENAIHMAQSAAERLAKKGVPEIGTPRKSAPKGVPETGTEGVPKVGTEGVPEIGTYKDIPLNTQEKTSSARAAIAEPAAGPDDGFSPSGQTHEGPEVTAQVEGGEDLPFSGFGGLNLEGGDQNRVEALEQVPLAAPVAVMDADEPDDLLAALVRDAEARVAGIAGLCPVPRSELASRPARDPERMTQLRALLSASHKSRLEHLRADLAGATRNGIPNDLMTRLTDEELQAAAEAAKEDAATYGSFAKAARVAVERLIGEPLPRAGGASATAPAAVTLPGAYMTAEEKAAQAASAPVVTAGETWYGRKSGQPYEISEVTSQSVFVDGLGEYTLAKFLANFRND